MAHHIAVHHADDFTLGLGDQTVLVGEVHGVTGVSNRADIQQFLTGLGQLAPDVIRSAF
ncbi:hypothetical protein D3C76_1675320 [compost metagenome]